MNRTDIHSPKNFDPAKYEYVGVVYLGHSNMWWEMVGDQFMADEFEAADTALRKHGWQHGNFASKETCDHCGAFFRYGCVFKHENGEAICVGHICSHEAFGHNNRLEYDMVNLRRKIELSKKRFKMEIKANEYIKEHKIEKEINLDNDIVKDMKYRLFQYGSLSEKQLNFVKSLWEQHLKRQEWKKDDKPVPVTDERIEFEGKVLSIKTERNPFAYNSYVEKMCFRDNRNFTLWGTCPKGSFDKGDMIKFVASVKVSGKDKCFGFFKRPTKIEVLKEV